LLNSFLPNDTRDRWFLKYFRQKIGVFYSKQS
jgi:hypothetical protein